MPIDFDGLFARLGPAVKVTNLLLAAQAQYRGTGTTADLVLAAYADRKDLVQPVLPTFDSLAGAMAGQVGQLKALADRTLADLQLVLNAPDPSPATVLDRLAEEMALAGESVLASTVGTPAVTAVAGNVGTGVILASKVDNLGRDAETSIPETVRFECVADRFGSASAGGETFSVTGWPAIQPNTYGTRGNGNGQPIAVANVSGNRLANGSFDAFGTANVPDSWTIDAGAAGTTIFSEASVVHSAGGKSLKLQGNGSTATVTLSQSVVDTVSVTTRYAAGVFLRKGAGTFASGSTLTVRITDGASFNQVLYSGDPSTLTTSFALSSVFWNTGHTLPAVLKFQITWTSAGGVASTGQIFVDDAAHVTAYTFGSISYAAFRGDVDFVAGDAFTVATTNTEAVFQGWFSRFYSVQMPSSGSPTQPDSLAT